LQKVKIKNPDITEHTITSVYEQASKIRGLQPRNAFEDLMQEVNNVKHFNTGVDELDKCLGDSGIGSDEITEVCGASGSGKTYFCLKLAALALLEQDVACIYIDTSNYLNTENITSVIKNYISHTTDASKKQLTANEVLGRLKIIKVNTLDELSVLLAMILS
jgi:RecA/RadA recombinase